MQLTMRPLRGPPTAVSRTAVSQSMRSGSSQQALRMNPARNTVVRFRSIDRPVGDAHLAHHLAPAFDNTPPELVAELQLRKFLGMSGSRELLTNKVHSGIRGADASLTVCGTIIEVNDFKHAVVALVIKENSNAQKLHELTLHWATCQHEGSVWIPPPAGLHQFPSSLIANSPGCGAWRTPFALHPSPDGKPMHVALLQIPMEGVLSSGGVTFVLNTGHHWMHNPHHGRDWFVQLSGHLPVTTDLESLPDAQMFPASLDQAQAPGEQEIVDRLLLKGQDSRTAELQQRQHAATMLAEQAAKNAAAAAAAVDKAQQDFEAAARQLEAAEVAVQALLEGVDAVEATANAAKASAGQCCQEMAVVSAAAGASLDVDGDGSVVAEARTAEAKLASAKAAAKAAESVLQAHQADLTKAQATLVSAKRAFEVAEAAVAVAKDKERDAAEDSRSKAAEAVAVVEAASRELARLTEECAAATARVWAHVEQRQMLALKRFLVEVGPKEPLNLAWLLPPSRSGRSLPVVPTAFNGVRNIQSAGEHGSWKELEPCSMQDLQSVMRLKLRKWLGVTPSQELHVIQYRCSTRLPGGAEVPILVWVTESQEAADSDKTGAVLVIAVDQSAAGSRSGRLQLHWGAALREGMAASQLAGPGWKTSSAHNWESSGCTLVTPLTAWRVPKLGIGQLPGQKPAFAGVHHVSGDYCALTDAPAASDMDVPRAGDGGVERQAHVVLLQLPLEGLFMHGGLTFTLKDSLGFHLHNASNGKAFFLELGMMMQQLKYMTQPRVFPPEEPEQGDGELQEPTAAADDGMQG